MIDLTYNEALLRHIRNNLERFVSRALDGRGLKKATVAITIVDLREGPAAHDIPFYDSWADHAAVLLTKRAFGLRHHSSPETCPHDPLR